MQPTSPTIPALIFSLPTGIATFIQARSLAKAAQAAICNGASPAPVSADGTQLLDPQGNAITATVQNYGVLDANNQPTSFTFKPAPLGATPNPATDNTATSMRILADNMDQIAAALADYYFSEGQEAGTGVQGANNNGANVEDLENEEYPVTFQADAA
jgi:hypothetical protein